MYSNKQSVDQTTKSILKNPLDHVFLYFVLSHFFTGALIARTPQKSALLENIERE